MDSAPPTLTTDCRVPKDQWVWVPNPIPLCDAGVDEPSLSSLATTSSHLQFDSVTRQWLTRVWPPPPGKAAERADFMRLYDWVSGAVSDARLKTSSAGDSAAAGSYAEEGEPLAQEAAVLTSLHSDAFHELIRLLASQERTAPVAGALSQLALSGQLLTGACEAELLTLHRTWANLGQERRESAAAATAQLQAEQSIVAEMTDAARELRAALRAAGMLTEVVAASAVGPQRAFFPSASASAGASTSRAAGIGSMTRSSSPAARGAQQRMPSPSGKRVQPTVTAVIDGTHAAAMSGGRSESPRDRSSPGHSLSAQSNRSKAKNSPDTSSEAAALGSVRAVDSEAHNAGARSGAATAGGFASAATRPPTPRFRKAAAASPDSSSPGVGDHDGSARSPRRRISDGSGSASERSTDAEVDAAAGTADRAAVSYGRRALTGGLSRRVTSCSDIAALLAADADASGDARGAEMGYHDVEYHDEDGGDVDVGGSHRHSGSNDDGSATSLRSDDLASDSSDHPEGNESELSSGSSGSGEELHDSDDSDSPSAVAPGAGAAGSAGVGTGVHAGAGTGGVHVLSTADELDRVVVMLPPTAPFNKTALARSAARKRRGATRESETDDDSDHHDGVRRAAGAAADGSDDDSDAPLSDEDGAGGVDLADSEARLAALDGHPAVTRIASRRRMREAAVRQAERAQRQQARRAARRAARAAARQLEKEAEAAARRSAHALLVGRDMAAAVMGTLPQLSRLFTSEAAAVTALKEQLQGGSPTGSKEAASPATAVSAPSGSIAMSASDAAMDAAALRREALALIASLRATEAALARRLPGAVKPPTRAADTQTQWPEGTVSGT